MHATGLQGSNDHGFSTHEGGTIKFLNRPRSGRFRYDGHKWEKKYHSFLKVQKERKIRVRYAHGRDGLNLVRKSYWLIDEKERPVNNIVLVHYVEKPRDIGRRGISGPPGDFAFQNRCQTLNDHNTHERDELEDSTFQNHCQTLNDYNTRECDELEDSAFQNHCQILHYLNTCEWHELLQQEDSNNSTPPIKDEASVPNQSNPTAACVSRVDVKLEESGANHTNMEEISDTR